MIPSAPILQAVSMPQAMDDAWSAMGGGPADLTFPDEFAGRWLAESTLVNVETPLGPEFVPNPQVIFLIVSHMSKGLSAQDSILAE